MGSRIPKTPYSTFFCDSVLSPPPVLDAGAPALKLRPIQALGEHQHGPLFLLR
jgi:hypothetical protein